MVDLNLFHTHLSNTKGQYALIDEFLDKIQSFWSSRSMADISKNDLGSHIKNILSLNKKIQAWEPYQVYFALCIAHRYQVFDEFKIGKTLINFRRINKITFTADEFCYPLWGNTHDSEVFQTLYGLYNYSPVRRDNPLMQPPISIGMRIGRTIDRTVDEMILKGVPSLFFLGLILPYFVSIVMVVVELFLKDEQKENFGKAVFGFHLLIYLPTVLLASLAGIFIFTLLLIIKHSTCPTYPDKAELLNQLFNKHFSSSAFSSIEVHKSNWNDKGRIERDDEMQQIVAAISILRSVNYSQDFTIINVSKEIPNSFNLPRHPIFPTGLVTPFFSSFLESGSKGYPRLSTEDIEKGLRSDISPLNYLKKRFALDPMRVQDKQLIQAAIQIIKRLNTTAERQRLESVDDKFFNFYTRLNTQLSSYYKSVTSSAGGATESTYNPFVQITVLSLELGAIASANIPVIGLAAEIPLYLTSKTIEAEAKAIAQAYSYGLINYLAPRESKNYLTVALPLLLTKLLAKEIYKQSDIPDKQSVPTFWTPIPSIHALDKFINSKYLEIIDLFPTILKIFFQEIEEHRKQNKGISGLQKEWPAKCLAYLLLSLLKIDSVQELEERILAAEQDFSSLASILTAESHHHINGLVLGDASSDGDCLFDAIAQLMNEHRGARHLRELAVNYMREHPDQFLEHFEGQLIGLNARITAMEGTLAHGDHYEIEALARRLERQIIVISNDKPTLHGNEANPPLFLHHIFYDINGVQVGHYRPFRLLDTNTDISVIMGQVREKLAITPSAINRFKK